MNGSTIKAAINGTIIGYDPGGNNAHGLALLTYSEGHLQQVSIKTLNTAHEVLRVMSENEQPLAIGIDTLTCWSTGPSGWRPADRWLRAAYPDVTKSVASPNSLFGSMGLNGMSVLLRLRQIQPDIRVSETHPKVLYRALTGKKYDYSHDSLQMDRELSKLVGAEISTQNDHEWDAIISAFAMHDGLTGNWVHDLHAAEPINDEEIVQPCGSTHYWWPE